MVLLRRPQAGQGDRDADAPRWTGSHGPNPAEETRKTWNRAGRRTPRGARVVRAPRGTELSCKGWQQEAALRMLMNNLDPEVAEDPDDLIVYGGSGKAGATGRRFDAIVATLRRLEERRDAAGAVGQAGRRLPHARAPRAC